MNQTLHARGPGSSTALRVLATLALCLSANAWAGSSPFVVSATPSVTIGQSISDSATVTGNVPTGTVTFEIYGPDDASCAGSAVFNSVSPLIAGVATSAAFTPTTAGTYRWTALYSGDINNSSATALCNSANQTSVVSKASPTISSSATTSATLGQTIADNVTLAAGSTPTGSINFSLYGPNDATCTGGPVFTGTTSPINGNGTYGSGNFTPSLAGTYRWTATYNGDANNNPVTAACNAANATSTINPPVLANPTISTAATAAVILGQPISDVATLTGGNTPTGNITFTLYGPSDATCAGASVFTNVKAVNGGGSATSDNFTPSTAGTYQWVASYAGDANNNPVAGTCGDANETSVVSTPVLANPSISSTATVTAFLGETISDIATLAGGNTPTGNITFNLYGPDNATCAGAPIFTSANSVNGSGAATSSTFTPIAAGTYRWVASYAGDSNNNPVAGACGDTNETSTVANPLNISPNPLDFGNENLGLSDAEETITVSNEGSVAITINGVVVTGDPDFAISSTTCPTNPATLAAGASCEVNVVFSPTAFTARSATVTITSNIGVHTLSITGTGTRLGGGSIDLWTLLGLSAFVMWRLRKREQTC